MSLPLVFLSIYLAFLLTIVVIAFKIAHNRATLLYLLKIAIFFPVLFVFILPLAGYNLYQWKKGKYLIPNRKEFLEAEREIELKRIKIFGGSSCSPSADWQIVYAQSVYKGLTFFLGDPIKTASP